MVVATYYGGDRDNEVYDYTTWYEWVDAIKDDFRRFIDYKLVDLKYSENLIKELNNASHGLLNKCPYSINHIKEFNIDVGDTYTIFEYPVYDEKLDRFNCNYAIISRDYRKFIFVDSINSTPVVKVFEVGNVVIEERIIPRIDLDWKENLVLYNLNYLRGDLTSIKELGGFAEEPGDVDGDYEAFNYCLAEEYAASMIAEDFESLGEMDAYLFRTIAHWLNYDGKIGSNNEELIKNIPSGNFLTAYGRTFADAVCERRLGELVNSLIYNGNTSPRVYFTAIAFCKSGVNTLNYIFNYIKDKNEYLIFVKELLVIIDTYYNEIEDYEKELLIEQIKPYIKKMVCANSIRNSSKCLEKYEWLSKVFNKKNKSKSLENKK